MNSNRYNRYNLSAGYTPRWVDYKGNMANTVNQKERKLTNFQVWTALKQAWLTRCTEENRNLLIMIEGGTGDGKSYAALRLAQELDSKFDTDRICFTPEQLLKMIKMDLPPASAIILDESQISADHRKWYSVTVDTIRYITSTARFKNNILIFTAPDVNLIDKDARHLFHYKIEMSGQIDYIKKKSYARIHRVFKTNYWGGKYSLEPKHVYGVVKLGIEGRHVNINRVQFALPSDWLVAAYESKRGVYMDKFYDFLESRLDKIDTKKNENLIDTMVGEIMNQPVSFQKESGKWDPYLVMNHFDCSREKAMQALALVKKKHAKLVVKVPDVVRKAEELVEKDYSREAAKLSFDETWADF